MLLIGHIDTSLAGWLAGCMAASLLLLLLLLLLHSPD
jgi:hypothetical protein